jgi:CheY-like chemotaxis protein
MSQKVLVWNMGRPGVLYDILHENLYKIFIISPAFLRLLYDLGTMICPVGIAVGNGGFSQLNFAMARRRILLVDDNRLLAKAITMSLSEKGYDVNVSYNGAEAVTYLFEEKPDLVLLDIRLPDCDGWFLARLLNRLGLEVPLIVISALEPDRAKVAEVRPYAYIQKPFDMGELTKVVERSLVGEKQPVEGEGTNPGKDRKTVEPIYETAH